MEVSRRTVLMGSAAILATPGLAWADLPPNLPQVVADIPVNYDESKAGSYTLPDPLTAQDGTRITDAAGWMRKRRPEIVKLFETQQYGIAPGRPAALAFELREKEGTAFGGKAKRRQVKITFTPDRTGPEINLVIYTPAAATGAVPILLAINFTANAATFADPAIYPGTVWSSKTHQRVPYGPGALSFGHIDPMPLLDAGFGVAAFCYGDVDPDDLAGLPFGIRALYLKPGQTQVAADGWGSVSAWAWGISRVIDYLETDDRIDAKRIAIHGVSRLGKTVMWAGAHDTRIAATIASCSGEGGAALSRRNFGETIGHLVAPSRYPYQFAPNYARWKGFPDKAPMDANLLVALHAPRPLLLQTGFTDAWSDPKGEFLAAVDAGKVYRLLGKRDLGTNVWPEPKQPLLGDLSYYMHPGGHGVEPGDWSVYLDFLKMHLKPEA